MLALNCMKKIIKKIFIPHPHNLYRPHAFRHKAVSVYSIGLILSHLSFGIVLDSATVSAQVSENIAKQIVSLANEKRVRHGVGPLTENEKLNKAAKARANDMFKKGYWDHFSPDGKEPWDAVTAENYKYSYAGENLAKGFTDANATINAWMNSPTHRENLLNSNYENIGVAVKSGLLNTRNTTIIVQLFASPFEKGVKPITAFGKQAEAKDLSLTNVVSTSNIPYASAWLLIVLMLIADGIMLYKQGRHKDRKHRIHIGIASIFILILFSLLTVNVVSIL